MYINKNIKEKFWNNVKKTDSCWNWIGANKQYRYGRISINKKSYTTHRISWILHYGKIPKGLFVLHKCDNHLCVNPKHLFVGTQKDNMQDKILKGRSRNQNGENNNMSKLTGKIVLEIRRLYNDKNIPRKEISKMFNISTSNIDYIVTNKTWKHI